MLAAQPGLTFGSPLHSFWLGREDQAEDELGGIAMLCHATGEITAWCGGGRGRGQEVLTVCWPVGNWPEGRRRGGPSLSFSLALSLPSLSPLA